MRTLWTLTAAAVGMIVLVVAIRWVRLGAEAEKSDWLYSTRIDWIGLIDVLVMGAAVAILLVCGRGQPGWIPGFVLAAGLVVTAVVGMARFSTGFGGGALLLAFCLSLGLVVVLAGMRHWNLLWLATAALMGTLPQVMGVVSAACSFMRQ